MYRLLRTVESSALADVCRAEKDGGAGAETVILKLFHAHTTDARVARLLATTAQSLSQVGHPAILPLREVGLAFERLVVVQPDVGGRALGSALGQLNRQALRPPLFLTVAWVTELLHGLQALHDAGLVHGALTPGNVWLHPEGSVYVTDVGALMALSAAPSLRALIGQGRSSYRAPEAQGGQGSVAGDIYAASAILYELLTLREAATGAKTPLPPPSHLKSDAGPALDAVVMKALSQKPEHRYVSAGDFADALRDAVEGSAPRPGPLESRRFVNQLFGRESKEPYAAPPWVHPFSLASLDAVGIGEASEQAELPIERGPFSGGLASQTPTSDGLPAWAEVTERETAALPETAVARRYRLDDGPVPPSPQKTRRQFAVPFRRADEPEIPNSAALRRSAQRRSLQAARLGAVALLVGVATVVVFWAVTTSNHTQSILDSIPGPIARQVAQWSAPATSRRPSPTPKACYQPPAGAGARLTVAVSNQATIEIDEMVVCGPATDLKVIPGEHALVVYTEKGRWSGVVTLESGHATTVKPPVLGWAP